MLITTRDDITKAYITLLNQQQFDESALDYSILRKHEFLLTGLARMSNSSITVFDCYKKEHAFYADNLSAALGYHKKDVEKNKGSFIDEKIHPDDFTMLMRNGITILKLYINFSEDERLNHKLINEYRIMKADGHYIRVIEQHQILELDGKGNMWLVMSILDISPNQNVQEPIKSQLLNFRTGKFTLLPHCGETMEVDLTHREKEILQLVKEGFLSKEISDKLCISLHTVNTHRQRVLEKLGANNSMEAVILASRLGLI